MKDNEVCYLSHFHALKLHRLRLSVGKEDDTIVMNTQVLHTLVMSISKFNLIGSTKSNPLESLRQRLHSRAINHQHSILLFVFLMKIYVCN